MPRQTVNVNASSHHRSVPDDVIAVARDRHRVEAAARTTGAGLGLVAVVPPLLTPPAARVLLVIMRTERDRRSVTERGRSVCDIEAIAS